MGAGCLSFEHAHLQFHVCAAGQDPPQEKKAKKPTLSFAQYSYYVI